MIRSRHVGGFAIAVGCAVLFLAPLSSAGAASVASSRPSASTSLTSSGCELTVDYTWSSFPSARQVRVQVMDDTTHTLLGGGGHSPVGPSGSFGGGFDNVTSGDTYSAQGWLIGKNGNVIGRSLAASAPVTPTC